MSSFPLFSSAPVEPAFSAKSAVVTRKFSAETLLKTSNIVPASRLELRPTPEMASAGIPEIDALTGGLPRGSLTEVCGTASSGRTSFVLRCLAASTCRQEACAFVDVTDAFDPSSAASAGMNFEKLLWVRCGTEDKPSSRRRNAQKNRTETRLEQALRVTDLLLQGGGFGVVAIDLGDLPFPIARRVPLASWFRFQRAIEHTPTVLLAITPAACTQSCAALLLKMKAAKKPSAFSSQRSDEIPHTRLLEGLEISAEVVRSRFQRKPPKSVTTAFLTQAVHAG